ncbi:MAG: ROK family protein, partial [Gammaproteobacteria bacterium]
FINDLAASAYALQTLPSTDYNWLSEHQPQNGHVKLMVSMGTGLGMALITPDNKVLPSEGGHSSFAPHNLHEYQLLRCLMQRYKRISAERVLSGNGLANLYWAHTSLHQTPVDITPAEIMARANQGESVALAVIRDFFSILSSFIGDMALISLAEGGIYLTGGVLDKIWPFYDAESFMARLSNKGRFADFCARIPIAKITAEHIGLLGCASALQLMATDRNIRKISNL